MKRLTSKQGHVFTQSDDNTPIKLRVLATTLFLASTDNPDNWKEIPEAEAELIRQEQELLTLEEAPPDSLQTSE